MTRLAQIETYVVIIEFNWMLHPAVNVAVAKCCKIQFKSRQLIMKNSIQMKTVYSNGSVNKELVRLTRASCCSVLGCYTTCWFPVRFDIVRTQRHYQIPNFNSK